MGNYSIVSSGLIALVVISMGSCKTMSISTHSKTPHDIINVISSMTDIESMASKADLIVFDLDHTVLEAKTVYCHSNWFYDQYEDALKQGVNEELALSVILPPWEQSQRDCSVKAVEPMTPALIKDMQARGKKVMALTTRSQHIADDTINQLKSLGVDFSKSAPNPATDSFLDGVYSKAGIVFTTEYRPKGEVLKAYLARANMAPKMIVFVDDSMRNLVSVSDVLGRDGVVVHAFHYPLVKRSLPDWDKDAARAEWEKHHGKLVFAK